MKRQPPSYKMKSRMVVVLAAVIILGFSLVLTSLFRLQIVQGADLQARALSQQLRTTRIGANRGSIYDTNGKILAASTTAYNVCLDPNALYDKDDPEGTKLRRDAVIDCLYSQIGVDRAKVEKLLLRTDRQYEVVYEKLDQTSAQKLLAFIQEKAINGIFLEKMTARSYPYGNFAASVLGFTNNDGVGAYGLESHYDKILSGTPGRVVSLRDRNGVTMTLEYEQVYDAQDGNSLVLTIDETIQHYVEKNLETAIPEHKVGNRAVGIVMDVKTGAVLAMSVKPDFDPNKPTVILDENVLTELQELKDTGTNEEYQKALRQAQYDQWRNKAISDPYEPGSVFKIITAAMALETGASTANTPYYCSGVIEVAGTPQHCWVWSSRGTGHGQQTMVDAVVNSCNPAFITMGQAIGALNFASYFDNFGLRSATGIDLPGEAGSIFHSSYTLSDLSSSSFGQTQKMTPIQIITACCAAVNGGKLMQPYVVKQILDSEGNVVSNTEPMVKRQVVSEEVSKELGLMLEQVVERGSGSGSKVPGYRIGGKTGTSEKLDKKFEGGGKNILSFFGYAPVDDPQIACLVLIDEPDLQNAYGSTIAAPIVGSILADVLPYMGLEPHYTEEELAARSDTTPYLLNYDIHDAQSVLRVKGLQYRVIGEGTKVINQLPGAAEPVPPDGVVVLYTEEVTEKDIIELPSVVGMSPTEANNLLVGRGLNVAISGEEVEGQSLQVTNQSPEAGERVPKGSVVTLYVTPSEPQTAEAAAGGAGNSERDAVG